MKKISPYFSLARIAVLACTLLLFSSTNAQVSTTAATVFMDWSTTAGSQNMFQKSVTRTIPGTTNVIVAGSTLNSSGNYDIFVAKYNGSGVMQWSQTYAGSGGGNDIASDVSISSNEIYVCGTYYKDATDSNNAIIIKYDASGNQRWTATYNGSGSHNDGFSSVLASGNKVVAVGSSWAGSTNKYDMLTMKYDTAGTLGWTTTYDNSSLSDAAVSLAIRSGSIFVTGASQTATTTYKIATWKINPTTGAIISTTLSSGTAFGIDRVSDIQEDASGNVYIAGTVLNTTTGYDFETIKYDASLSIVWSTSYDAGVNLTDVANGLQVDASGNVYVTGYSTSSTQGRNYTTVKYNSSGSQQWVQSYNGKSNRDDEATAIVNDASGNIYISGYAKNVGMNDDYYTIKYNSSGTLIWQIGFNSILNYGDRATSIAIDTAGAIIVTGQSSFGTIRQYNTVRYYERDVTTPNDGVTGSAQYTYLENKGQLLKTDTTVASSIKYYTMHSSPQMFFANDGISYEWEHIDTTESTADTVFRVDMFLKNAATVVVKPMDERSEYYNFFVKKPGSYPAAKTYDHLIYAAPWSNIDLIFGSNNVGVKYSFVVKPGGNPSNISWQYVGASSVTVNGSGALVLGTSLGNLTQRKATAYQIDGSGNYVSLAWQPTYTIATGNILTFSSIGTYDATKTLVLSIDWGAPASATSVMGNLVWNTYYGSAAQDFFMDVATDPEKRPYFTGYSSSNMFPVGSGQGYTIAYTGGYDAIVIKMDTSCAPKWTTYFGGVGTETSYGIALDPSENVIVCGYSMSGGTNSIPLATPTGAYKDSVNGGDNIDAYIAEFDSTGTQLVWSTFYGGDDGGVVFDRFNKCEVDAQGNMFFVGDQFGALTPTYSKTGAYNSTTGSGLVARFTNGGARNWVTKFSADIENVAIDKVNNVYITGWTHSGIPTVNKGGGIYSSPIADSTDAFITEFKASSDTVIWSTYYGGAGYDRGMGLAIDDNNSAVYMVGRTRSDTSYSPHFPMIDYNNSSSLDFLGAFSSTQTLPNSTTMQDDAFIVRFDQNNGAPVWSTYFGGFTVDMAYCATVDSHGYLYVGGYTGSGSTHFSTNEKIDFPQFGSPGYYVKPDITGWEDDDADGFIAMFNSNEQLLWTTYYGDGLPQAVYHSPNAIRGITLAADSDLYTASYSQYGYSQSTLDPQKYLPMSSVTDYFQTQASAAANNAEGLGARYRLFGNSALGIESPHPSIGTIPGDFVIYPNPSADNISLNVNVPEGMKSEIVIYDMLGQVMYRQSLEGFTGNVILHVNVSQWSDAVYNIQLVNSNGAVAHRFVKTSQ